MAAAAVASSGPASFLRELLSRTSLSAPSPFESYGPIAAARAPRAGAAAGFSLEDELRRRMSEFVSGVIRPVRDEFVGLVRSAMIGLEKRTYGTNTPTVVAVDMISGRAVPAASIDSSLSDKAIEKAIGRDPAADAAVVRRENVASGYRARLAPFLRDAIDNGRPFDDWADALAAVSSSIPGCEISVVEGKSYIGPVAGRFTADRAENRRMLAELSVNLRQNHGREITLIHDAEMRPGLPVFAMDGRTVPASSISQSLAAQKLDEVFEAAARERIERANANLKSTRPGVKEEASRILASAPQTMRMVTFEGRMSELLKSAPSPGIRGMVAAGGTAVIKLADRRPAAIAVAPGQGVNSRGPAANRGPRPGSNSTPLGAMVVQYDQPGEGARIVNARNGQLTSFKDPAQLPDGRYTKEIWGMPAGFLEIRSGSVRHLAKDGVEENMSGPSFEPAKGSGENARWALAGHSMTQNSWDSAMAQARDLGHGPFQKLVAAGREMDDRQFRVALDQAAFVISERRAEQEQERERDQSGSSPEYNGSRSYG
jgi:hypothetical protein